MIVRKKSALDGKTRSMELDITKAQLRAYNKGIHAQIAFPDLSSEERQFIKSGITPYEWDKTFNNNDCKRIQSVVDSLSKLRLSTKSRYLKFECDKIVIKLMNIKDNMK